MTNKKTTKKSGVSKEIKKDAPETLTLTERINKRLIEPVQVRHLNPNYCMLILKKGDKSGEKTFKGYQSVSIKVQDLINIANTTKLFLGEDGFGKNAFLYIEDSEIRQYLGFEKVKEDGTIIPQEIMTEKVLLSKLNDSTKKEFELMVNSFKNNITKIKLLEDVIQKTGFNDAQKIKYIEKTLNINIDL